MNGPERLAEARKRITDIKITLSAGRNDPQRTAIYLCEAGVSLCDLIEWILEIAEEDAAD